MKSLFAYGVLFLMTISPVEGAGPHMMQPRVPAGHLEEARALKNPLAVSPELIAQGKILYEGKGSCANCHGINGDGKGPGAANLNPSPRNFIHQGFWHHRTEGEIFWVVKHGSPGTAMIPFGGMLSDDEIWTIIRYEQTFSQHSTPHKGKEPRGKRGSRMSGGNLGSQQGGHEPCCGDR